MNGTRKNGRMRAAVCSALAAGALTGVTATAHDVAAKPGLDSNAANVSSTTNVDAQNTTRGDAAGASMTAEADQSNRARAGSSDQRDADIVWSVVPVALQAQSDQMANGCWVPMYSRDNFDGRYVSIVGPAQIREMWSPYGTGMNNWESAIDGPNATVTTYDNEDFQSRNAKLRANQRYPDLDDSKLGLFDDIESMKVECSKSSQTASKTGS